MRLRHKKWSERVLKENVDIAFNIDNFDINVLKDIDLVEIGSGCGEFLIELAKANRDKKLLGIEINKNAFAQAIRKSSSIKEEVKNFIFLNSPIEKVIDNFESDSISNIYINFPDPWPKKKQERRRLSYPTLLEKYYRILKDGGSIYFRTDNMDLFTDSIEYFKTFKKFEIETINPYFNDNGKYLLPTSEYEQKFKSRGIDIKLIIAKK